MANEPTGNLDSQSGAEILRVLNELNDNGITSIMVTRDQDGAGRAQRVLPIQDGKLVADERVEENRGAG